MVSTLNKRDSYHDLTDKQKRIVDAFAELKRELDRNPTYAEVANEAYDTCSAQYASNVVQTHEEIAEDRADTNQVVATDGEGAYDVKLSETDAWKAIRVLPAEQSKRVYDQVKRFDSTR